jgi:hypothetical protein
VRRYSSLVQQQKLKQVQNEKIQKDQQQRLRDLEERPSELYPTNTLNIICPTSNSWADIVMGASEDENREKEEERKRLIKEGEIARRNELKEANAAHVQLYQTNTSALSSSTYARIETPISEIDKRREELITREFDLLNEAVLYAAKQYPTGTHSSAYFNAASDIIIVDLEGRIGDESVDMQQEEIAAQYQVLSNVVLEEEKRRLGEEEEKVGGKKKKPRFITSDNEGSDMEH